VGRADYYISIVDPSGTEIYVAEHFENPRLPVTFELDIPLEEEGEYTLFVNDEDRGLEGSDDNCAIIPFNFQDSTLTLDGVVAALDILNPIDTITASDSVFVLSFPPSPDIAFSAPNPFCAGEVGLLKATPYEENLQWSKDNQIIAGATASILEVTESGRYTVSYTSDGGCTVVAMPIQVNVTPLPAEPIFENTDNLLALSEDIILTDDLSLQWYLNDALIADATETTLCTEESGIYTLEITDANTGCINRFSQEVEYDVKIENCNLTNTESIAVHDFKLYPNPASTWLTIEFQSVTIHPVEVKLFDIIGKSQNLSISRAGNSITIDVENLPNGIYWLQFTLDGNTITKKVVKQ
ncbi:MAG: T9SS type A sorting domain-containing protein, partial [Bacteroidota bacterium]